MHFSFFWVINAGSLSNGDKKKRFITTNEKDRNKINLKVKNKCHCKVQQADK